MDANQQRFWVALGGRVWVPTESQTVETHRDFLRLAKVRPERPLAEDTAVAEERLKLVPGARDPLGGRAWYDAGEKAIFATSAGLPPTKLLDVAGQVTDFALGFDGYLYIAAGGQVTVRDPLGRYPEITPELPAGFTAWRLAPDPRGGAWVLDRSHKKLARLHGRLFPADPVGGFPDDMFRPQPENPSPFRFELLADGWLGAEEDPVAIAVGSELGAAVLVWKPDNRCHVRLAGGKEQPGARATLSEAKRAWSLAWLEGRRFAVLISRTVTADESELEALVYEFDDGVVEEIGEIFPLREPETGPFLHGLSQPVDYPSREVGSRPLVSISLPSYAAKGSAWLGKRDSEITGVPGSDTVRTNFDSGVTGTAWHRLYVEAEIPPETGFIVYAAASDAIEVPSSIPETEWCAHYFGGIFTDPALRKKPRGVWLRSDSELPWHSGFLKCEREPDRSGLFTALLQRSGRRVRTLRGRFLHLRIELIGNTRATPCVHALRAYAPRFSYQDRYLPELYRESLFGPAADETAPDHGSTPADFLGRFLANFESVLTPLEDKIAASWMVTDPRTAPVEAIPWIGSWIGVTFEPWFPPERRREHIRRAADMFARRGTRRGLEIALDAATGGGVSQGRIVVVEDYWFRRTFATILGLDLDRPYDPLFGGPVTTGNSKVGRTLFLGEQSQREFFALFDADIPLANADQQAVEQFFESLAHRATVIVHETVRDDEWNVITHIAAQEAPAHLELRVRRASRDFMIGLASLVGVDTYLRPEPPPEPVEIEKSSVGTGPLLLRPVSLDPRMEGTSA